MADAPRSPRSGLDATLWKYPHCLSTHVWTCPSLAVLIPAPTRPLAQSLVPAAGCALEVRLQGSVILTKGWAALALTGA